MKEELREMEEQRQQGREENKRKCPDLKKDIGFHIERES